MSALDQIGTRAGKQDERFRSNAMEESILASMGDAVVAADMEGKFLVFNPAAERMFGKGAAEIRASEWSQHYGLFLSDKVTPYPPDQLPLARAIRGEEVNNAEIFVRTPS